MFFAWNTATHVQDNEQNPEKRPFTKQELQDFFDHADDQVTLIASAKKKGWLPAYRDAVMFKVAYSYGVRFNELRHLQTVDFSRNPHAPEFGRYGVVKVRINLQGSRNTALQELVAEIPLPSSPRCSDTAIKSLNGTPPTLAALGHDT